MNISIIDAPKARQTSFAQLFSQSFDGRQISGIEIPLIQRDYAQGRKTLSVDRIRRRFINAVCAALLPDSNSIELDFVYGDIESDVEKIGQFVPLDGQQRLTFLFLLHCYLAWRVKVDAQTQPWANFSYATRSGAREFCKFLTRSRPGFSMSVSAWLKDQADYLPTWDHDPTIQSMLVVLDDLAQWFIDHQVDYEAAWLKLSDANQPAISFHLLPLTASGLSDELYIKMNSRGKSLTPFENFKAEFEAALTKSHPGRVADFARKVDTDWSDILWKYRGDDNVIDDEFLRYFRFVTDLCAWNSAVEVCEKKRYDDLSYLTDLAEKVYGQTQPRSNSNLDFLFHAFDIWHGKVIKDEFEALLGVDSKVSQPRLKLFNPFQKEGVDLVHACCRHYGTDKWSKAHTLLLYGILLRGLLVPQQPEALTFPKQLRILRNLIEASGNEIRVENMLGLLGDVQHLILRNALDQVGSFNKAQKQNEQDKAAFLQSQPALETDLNCLEDHDLLRGGLTSFDLDPAQFQIRAKAFAAVFTKPSDPSDAPWREVSAALLAKGIYSPLAAQSRWTGYQFIYLGAPRNDGPWREIFRKNGAAICVPLMALLDAFAQGKTLLDQTRDFLNDSATVKDWRYYFVRYEAMRQGASGVYVVQGARGYQACMLDHSVMRSYYADPYLLASLRASGIGTEFISNGNWPKSFYGYEDAKRWLVLKKSSLKIRTVNVGWEVSIEQVDLNLVPDINHTLARLGIQNNLYVVPQQNDLDTDDRIALGAGLLRDLIAAGL